MITDQQFKDAADIIGCDAARIKTVYQVEAAGSAYLPDGRVKILFEGHRFWKRLSANGCTDKALRAAAEKYPNVLYRKWDKKQYKGGTAEWDRVSQAYFVCDLLDMPRNIVLEAASYGSFQIMGENHTLCGYSSAHEMLAAYNSLGEAEQLRSFVRFVRATKLDDELRAKNWAGFAKGYNGTGYRENQYDIKLGNAYKKFIKQGTV